MGIEMHASTSLAPEPCDTARCGDLRVDPVPRKSYESDESASESARETSCTDAVDNPLKLRESAMKRGCGVKGQKMCCYQHCPSPLHSKKWRVVTPGTSAGGRDWEPLVDQTLCDSCYSTYRKHGTFVRSVRTNEGWFRVDASGIQPASVALQTKKTLPSSKRNRMETANSEIVSKRQDRKFAALRVDLGEDKGSQSEDGSWEPRPSRSRRPSEKMKDIIQSSNSPSSVKRARAAKPDSVDGAQQYDMPLTDTMPETTFDSAPIGHDDFGDDNMLAPTMSPCDLQVGSSEMGLCSNFLGDDLLSTASPSSGEDELIDACLD